MTWFLGISFLLGAAGWGFWRHGRERDWMKAVLVCLLCTWWPAAVICPFFLDIRNPVYVALAAISFLWSSNDRIPEKQRVFHPALWCLLCVIAASACWAVNRTDAALRAVGILLAFAFLWNLVRTAGVARVARWLGSGLLIASYAVIVLVALGQYNPESVASDGRYKMTDELKATGAAALCFGALVRLFAEGMIQNGKLRFVHLVLAGVAAFAMIRTGTRGTLMQLTVALPLLLGLRLPVRNVESLVSRYVSYALAGVVLGCAVWLSVGEKKRSDYRQIFRVDDSGAFINTRVSVWEPSMAKAKERLWLGRGLGSSSFSYWADEEYKEMSSLTMENRSPVASQYLEVFYEFGLIGFLVFAWLLVVLCRNAVRTLLHNGPDAWIWRMLAIYAVVGLIEGMTHGGQITTGQQEFLRRWMIYCCVLSFPAMIETRRGVAAVSSRRERAGTRHRSRSAPGFERGAGPAETGEEPRCLKDTGEGG